MSVLSVLIQNEISRALPPKPAVAPKKRGSTGPQKKREAADKRYIKLLSRGVQLTGTIANKFGLSHMGCLSSLYELEKRGIVKRVRPADHGIPNAGRSLAWMLV